MQTTFPRLMLEHAKQRPTAPALREKVYGIWQTLTWADLAQLVRELAGGMAVAGLKRDDHIIIVGDNRPRLYASMLAAQALGAVPIPLYQDAAAAEFVFPIVNADVGFAIVEDQEQVDKLIEIRERCPLLTRIWYDDPRGLRNYNEPGLDSLDALVAAGKAHDDSNRRLFDEEVAQARPEDVAAMFFTSGTTGNPKGVLYSHRSTLLHTFAAALPDSLNCSASDVILWSASGQLVGSAGQSRFLLNPERPSPQQLRMVRTQRSVAVVEGLDEPGLGAANNARIKVLALTVIAGTVGPQSATLTLDVEGAQQTVQACTALRRVTLSECVTKCLLHPHQLGPRRIERRVGEPVDAGCNRSHVALLRIAEPQRSF